MRLLIKHKIILLSIFLVISSVSIIAIGIGAIIEEKYLENEENSLQTLANYISNSIEAPIIFEQYDEINIQLSYLSTKKSIEDITILSGTKNILASYSSNETKDFNDLISVKKNTITDDYIYIDTPLIYNGENHGDLVIKSSLSPLKSSLSSVYNTIVILALITIVILLILVFYLQGLISKPILSLVKTSKDIASGNLESRAIVNTNDEIKDLEISFNEMVDQIISAQKEAELAAKFRANFLSNMSHEIRTPMNGIVGVVDLIRKTKLDEKQEELVNIVKDSSSHLLTIINDILDLSKLEAGKMKLHYDVFSLDGVVKGIYSLFSAKVREKNLKFTFNIAENVPNAIVGDRTRLVQIISNFTSNAIKFTDEGEVQIKVSTDNSSENPILKFEVIDTGAGIDEENKKKLFKAFNQSDITSTKSHEGTGLGLAISKNLVELMNGDLGVDSEIGKGSNFWFTMESREDIMEPVLKTVEEDLEEKTTQLNQYLENHEVNALIVDDKAINLKVANLMFTKLGLKVHTVDSGFECLDFLKEKRAKVDFIFMDIQMPEMDGIETSKKIMQFFPNHPPIIALTANAMEGDKEKYLNVGMVDYLAKPIDIKTVVSSLVTQLHIS